MNALQLGQECNHSWYIRLIYQACIKEFLIRSYQVYIRSISGCIRLIQPDADLIQVYIRLYQVYISLMYQYQVVVDTGLIYQPDIPRVLRDQISEWPHSMRMRVVCCMLVLEYLDDFAEPYMSLESSPARDQ